MRTGNRRVFLLATGVLLAVGVGGAAVISSQAAVNTQAVPPAAKAQALTTFQGEYGDVSVVFASSAGTFGEWRQAEPSNTSGITAAAYPDDQAVYAVFVHGPFVVVGPVSSSFTGPITSSWDSGRIVFDDTSRVLGVRMWNSSSAISDSPMSTGQSAFDPAFDDR